MIIWQADPGWDATDQTRAPVRDPKTLVQTGTDPDGYHDLLSALRDDTTAFRRPVAVVHGDSHYFRIDKPFLDAQGRRLENFTRVETFGDHQENGDNDVHGCKRRRRSTQPRGVLLPAPDRAGQPHGRACGDRLAPPRSQRSRGATGAAGTRRPYAGACAASRSWHARSQRRHSSAHSRQCSW